MHEFKVGDLVVAVDLILCTELFEIERIGAKGEPYDTKWRRLNALKLRLATPEEIKAGRRL